MPTKHKATKEEDPIKDEVTETPAGAHKVMSLDEFDTFDPAASHIDDVEDDNFDDDDDDNY